ncbi:unnamed protein product [Timema podura]|uniref:STIM1/2 EF-hand domain-containing protein n=1 Tax=Timema podura TaxID=61482 RepID=A0ABN7PCW4_TIMPD|nr:unnamed protein product [Timema podura]
MHCLTRSVFILCLLISCWFREGKSENVKVAEVRQENSPQESVHKTSENEARVERTSKPSSYSGGSALSRTSSYSSRSDAQSAGIEAGIGENCHDDIVCLSMASNDRIGLEAIRALHRQLDDDANGNVDLSESDEVTSWGQMRSYLNKEVAALAYKTYINSRRARLTDHMTSSICNVGTTITNGGGGRSVGVSHLQAHTVEQFLREELKYEQGYERRQRAFHFNDDMHISVRELWEAWIRSEVSHYSSLLTSCRYAQAISSIC